MASSVFWEAYGPEDGFYLRLRRQGWHLTSCKPVYADKQVLGPHLTVASKTDIFPTEPTLFAELGDATARKLLRAIVAEPRTEEWLRGICGNEETLARHLTYFLAMGFIQQVAVGTWALTPACAHVDNLGPTLEWYVAQWFRVELQAPARHGVTLHEVRGELDVVAFVDDSRVWVECKSGKPENITEAHLREFLQRAYDFNPEMAVLLLDTTSDIEPHVVGTLNRLYEELARKDGCWDDPSLPVGALRIEAQPRYGKGVYWGARHLYVVNTRRDIGDALDSVLRHYHAHARHQRFPSQHGTWDFIGGTVERTHAINRPPAFRVGIPRWVTEDPFSH
jgi:hypothetical protein